LARVNDELRFGGGLEKRVEAEDRSIMLRVRGGVLEGAMVIV
jgi:hypothetical protein